MRDIDPYRATAGPELDLLISREILGAAPDTGSCRDYSSSIQAADEVKAKLESDFGIKIIAGTTNIPGKTWFARAELPSSRDTEVLAETYPLAICTLALVLKTDSGGANLSAPVLKDTELPERANHWLQLYRKARREESEPWEMPSETRRVLEAEIEANFPKAKIVRSEPKSSRWESLWPWLRPAVVVIGLILVTVVTERLMRNDQPKPVVLAKMEASSRTTPSQDRLTPTKSAPLLPSEPSNVSLSVVLEQKARPPAGVAQQLEAENLSRRYGLAPASAEPAKESERDLLRAKQLGAAPKPQILSTAPAAVVEAPRLTTLARAEALSEEKVSTLTSRNALAEADSFSAKKDAPSNQPAPSRGYSFQAPAAPLQLTTSGNSLRFISVDPRSKYRRNFNSPPPPKVLTAFQVQLKGEQLRVIDEDGSVYAGSLESRAGDKDSASQSNQQQFFRVAGTNHTLNQAMTFTGQMAFGRRANPAGNIEFQRGLGLNSPMRAALTDQDAVGKPVTLLTNSPQPESVQGQVSLGDTEFKVEAVRVNP